MATYNAAKNCLQMHVSKMADSITHADVHDTHVTINVGP